VTSAPTLALPSPAMKLEVSPSGRAACRGCKNPVAKGDLRFAESYVLPGSDQPGHRYWHLECAAKKLAGPLQEALAAYEGEVPNRAALDALIAAAPKKAKDRPLPHADRAPTGRAKCMQCQEPLEKGALRIGVERELEMGANVTKSAGYLHPGCAFAWTEEHLDDGDVEGWLGRVFSHSELTDAERQELSESLTPP